MENTIINSAKLIPYNEKDAEPFVFVSYPRRDIVKVEGVLRCMQRHGIRFWYDKQGVGIGAGSDWNNWIIDRLEKSSMFMCFLSNGVEQRPPVLDEIEYAIRRHKEKGQEYKVLFIFLEKMPARVFTNAGKPEIEEFIRTTQYIYYEGMTDSFVEQLTAEEVFSDSLIREEAFSAWKERSIKPLIMVPSELFPDNSYIYSTAFPNWDKENGFYKVNMDQMDPDAVCLICLDNQWCPPELYNDQKFWESGLLWEEGKGTRTNYQTEEVYRALLHQRQIVINRAFFYNSQVFSKLYDQTKADYQAFCELLKNGTFLVYLATETTPYDRGRYDVNEKNYEAWREICKNIPVYCVRMDWTDEETNRLKVEQLLFHSFENFCLTMAENHYLQEDIAAAFEMDEKQKGDFAQLWQDVQQRVAARDREKDPIYTRNRFYEEFLILGKTEVSKGILDIRKVLAPELKEIVDLQYGVNLPESLGIRPIYPEQGNLKDFYRSGRALKHGTRVLSKKELSYAIGEFWPNFMDDHESVDFPKKNSISLDEIVALRSMDEWKTYMHTISNGSSRAHLREVDFYDISYVWEKFYEWMSAAKTKCIIPVEWEEAKGAVSIIYRLGNEEIITVYHAKSDVVTIRTSRDPKEEIPASQDHTVLITIDYVCTDILLLEKDSEKKNKYMFSELRLFEGMTKDKLSEVRDEIMDRLKRMEETNQIRLCWNQKTAEERRVERRYRDDPENNEWRAQVENMQKC